jgi:hypothetical protein
MDQPASLDCQHGKAHVMARILWLRVAVVLLASSAIYGSSDTPPYTQVARVPSIVDGQGLNSFAFDPVDQRL